MSSTDKRSRKRGLFPVGGIGASAGGLDAFEKFFTAMPADSGMAFVLVQHLDPTHQSLTAQLLGRHTVMPVVEAEDRMPVKANHVYIIPPVKSRTASPCLSVNGCKPPGSIARFSFSLRILTRRH